MLSVECFRPLAASKSRNAGAKTEARRRRVVAARAATYGLFFDFRLSSGRVPETKHVHRRRLAKYFVDDSIRTVDHFPHGRLCNFRHDTPSLRQRSQRKRLVNEFVRKRPRATGIVPRDERDNLLQIVLCLRSEDYFEVHAATNLRASSAGTPSPRRACSRARWIPASSSISRAISARVVSSGSLVTRSMTISRLLM